MAPRCILIWSQGHKDRTHIVQAAAAAKVHVRADLCDEDFAYKMGILSCKSPRRHVCDTWSPRALFPR